MLCGSRVQSRWVKLAYQFSVMWPFVVQRNVPSVRHQAHHRQFNFVSIVHICVIYLYNEAGNVNPPLAHGTMLVNQVGRHQIIFYTAIRSREEREFEDK
jgi:hypothetical protein